MRKIIRKFISLFKIINNIRINYLNNLDIYLNEISIKKPYFINGRIQIMNHGKITIGNNFKVNSGINKNPIGGDTVFRLICKKNAKITIGNHVGISNSTFFAFQHIKIEDYVIIGGGCKIWDSNFHSTNKEIRGTDNEREKIISKEIIIKRRAFIGGDSIILKGVTIGENSVIAAGSVVVKDIPSNQIWGGNPARFLKQI